MLPPLLPMQSNNLHVSATQFEWKHSTARPEIQFMPSNGLKVQNPKCKTRAFPMPMEPCMLPDLGCVYPLYYCQGQPYLPNSQPQSHMNPHEQIANNIFRSTNGGLDCNKASKLVHNTECDLSLRLGLPSTRSSEIESSWGHEVEDVGSSSSCDGGKSCGPPSKGVGMVNLESSISSVRDKGFDFFSTDHIDEHHESCSSKWSSHNDCTFYMNGYD